MGQAREPVPSRIGGHMTVVRFVPGWFASLVQVMPVGGLVVSVKANGGIEALADGFQTRTSPDLLMVLEYWSD